MTVMIATPSFSGRLSVEYVLALSATQDLLRQHNITCYLAIISGSPYIAEVRNALASAALKNSQITDLFFIDDDLGWPAQKVLDFLQQSEDVLAGVYPK